VTMPRVTTSSANSWAVQWVIGRPTSRGARRRRRIWVTCSGVNLPGAPGRGSSLRTPRWRGGAWRGLGALEVDQASEARAQRRARIPTALRQADRLGDLSLRCPSKASKMMAARCRAARER